MEENFDKYLPSTIALLSITQIAFGRNSLALLKTEQEKSSDT